MSKHVERRRILRRDTLKVCLLPAGVYASQWLIGCGDDAQGSLDQPMTQPTSGPAGTGVPAASGTGASAPPVAGAGAAGTGATATAGTLGTSGSGGASVSSAAGSGGGAPIAGAGGASPAAVSGSGGASVAGAGGQGGATALAGAGGGSGVAGPGVDWATGGTKSIQGGYPDPFGSSGAGTMCVVYPTQTLGPCYANMPAMRQDISDGIGGLPVRLSLLVVRSGTCAPVSGASIDIWHSGSDGIYSAYATGTVCNPGMRDVRMDMFCRGVQVTDAMGRVDFNTVFPGWYKGRTIHIHFTVNVNGRATNTSQLYFEDALTDEILAQGDYKARGKRDTTNASDNTYKSGGATPAQVLLTTAKRTDGVLHAWKVLSISS